MRSKLFLLLLVSFLLIPQNQQFIDNPTFEGEYHSVGKDNIRLPDPWKATWVSKPPCRPLKPECDLPCPESCIKETVSQSSVISATDDILYISPITITPGTTSTLIVYTDVMTPIGAIEARLYINPVVMSTSVPITLSNDSTLMYMPGLIRYEREVSYTTVGRIDLFQVDISPKITGELFYEVDYWAGSIGGGLLGNMPTNVWEFNLPWTRLKGKADIQVHKTCVADTGCYWAEPEIGPINYDQAPYRAYTGTNAVKSFTYGRMGQWTVYQVITDVTPYQAYQFSAQLQAWQCNDEIGLEPCCEDRPQCISNAPFNMNMQVCIDNVCSEPGESFDYYSKFSITAYPESSTMTVSIKAAPMFPWAVINNDMYIGFVELVSLPHNIYLPLITKEG